MKLGCHVVPGQVYLNHASKAFDASEALLDERGAKGVQALVAKLLQISSKLAGALRNDPRRPPYAGLPGGSPVA